jgi:uncharacterized protein YndB with AHSA1/START domain
MVANKIEREIVVDAPVERVWAVVTQPEHLGQWFGTDTPTDVDLRVGGTLTFIHGDAVKFPVVIERYEPPRLLAWRWASDYPGEKPTEGNSTLVEFTLAEEGAGTRLTVVETGFAELDMPAEGRQKSYHDNVRGWGIEMTKLRAYAEQPAA